MKRKNRLVRWLTSRHDETTCRACGGHGNCGHCRCDDGRKGSSGCMKCNYSGVCQKCGGSGKVER